MELKELGRNIDIQHRPGMIVRKIQSYPFLGKLVVKESFHDILKTRIYALSDELLEKVFTYISYRELQRLKSTCFWFYVVIGSMTNKAFLSIRERVDDEIKAVESFMGTNDLVNSYMKVLNIISSEVDMLEVSFLDHVRANTFHFSGGNILDLLGSILNTSDFLNLDEKVDQIFTNINDYLERTEPVLQNLISSAVICSNFRWFGGRIVDLLDCFLNVDYEISFCQRPNKNEKHCQVVGKYYATVDHECLPPPKFEAGVCGTCDQLFDLLYYLRNHIRWNNYINYMSYKMSIADNVFVPEDVVTSPSGLRTKFVRHHPHHSPEADKRLFSANIDIYCHKLLSPAKCKNIIGNEELMDLMTTGDDLVNAKSVEYFSRIEKAAYECNFTMSVLHSPSPTTGNTKKTTVNVSIRDETCSIWSSTVNVC